MVESAISKGITIASEPDEAAKGTNTSFPDAVKELGEALHKRYPLRTSNLSGINIRGMIRIDVFNDYNVKQFGFKFNSLDKLTEMKNIRVVSTSGWGANKLIELVKGIQASFEQTEIPNRLSALLRR